MVEMRSSKQGLMIGLALLVMLSCSLPAPSDITGVAETEMALGVQQTMLAVQQTEVALDAETTAVQQTEVALDAETTAEQSPDVVVEQPTYTPYPTYTVGVEATETAQPTPEATLDIEARIESANILVYEDIRSYYELTPWVNRALSGMSFKGGKVVEVGDALGNFMTHLNSPTPWDLIIVAAESKKAVKGEFWDVILDLVNDDVALVAEIWYLDKIASGRISPLLSKCGIAFQRDWQRADGDSPLNYSLYWLNPEHELFSHPNVVAPLITAVPWWVGDIGDQIRLGSGGDAELLAGLHPREKSQYGTLATCMEGRVIFQTFSTHDYRQSHMIPLWQNYITYTLTNRFKKVQ